MVFRDERFSLAKELYFLEGQQIVEAFMVSFSWETLMILEWADFKYVLNV